MKTLVAPELTPEGILEYNEPNKILIAKETDLQIVYTFKINLHTFPSPAPYTQLQDNICNIYSQNTTDNSKIQFTIANCVVRINGSNINYELLQKNVSQKQT